MRSGLPNPFHDDAGSNHPVTTRPRFSSTKWKYLGLAVAPVRGSSAEVRLPRGITRVSLLPGTDSSMPSCSLITAGVLLVPAKPTRA